MNYENYVEELGKAARAASRSLRMVNANTRNEVLESAAKSLLEKKSQIMTANALDLEAAQAMGLSEAMYDRLTLTEERIQGMSDALLEIAAFEDPLGKVLGQSTTKDGLTIEKQSVPIGSILFIYESRPNVTIDGAALCLKSGNAVVLRGGKESAHSSKILVDIFRHCMDSCGVDPNGVQLVEHTDRSIVNLLLQRPQDLDLVIPRGGESLIKAVVEQSKIPVIKHYKGLCHIYVDASADLFKAKEIILNAKVQRPGVCNAMETLLLDRNLPVAARQEILEALLASDVKILGDEACASLNEKIIPATDEDWATEYLDYVLSVKTVSGLQEAVDHIADYGSGHTEAVLAQDSDVQNYFVASVDSSSVMINASTRFADGGMYGLGAEVGISTDKLHARGPMGVESLTSYKWIVRGNGQVRN
jgi:glutamate-5-semialdehyde dehydrogenase